MTHKRIEELAPGDLLEVAEPAGIARVFKVSDRNLLPSFFRHYAGDDARVVDLVMVDSGQKVACQYHKDDVVETIEPARIRRAKGKTA